MVRDKHDPYWMDIGEFVKHTPYGTYEIRKPSGKLYTWKYCEPLDLYKYFTQRFLKDKRMTTLFLVRDVVWAVVSTMGGIILFALMASFVYHLITAKEKRNG